MQLSKKEMVTAAFCAAAYAFLAVLILWGSLWSITVSCVGIGTFTNAVTALYFGPLCGKKERRACCGLCPAGEYRLFDSPRPGDLPAPRR